MASVKIFVRSDSLLPTPAPSPFAGHFGDAFEIRDMIPQSASPAPDSAPSRWHLAVNVPLGHLWSVILPVLVCLYFGLAVWLTLAATIGWWFLNLRFVDRYLPVVTNPLIEATYRTWQKIRGRSG